MQPTNGGPDQGGKSDGHGNIRSGVSLSGIRASSRLLSSIVDTACEYEHDLDLMRLVNYLDLYRVYLTEFGHFSEDVEQDFAYSVTAASFERFVQNSHLLSIAAAKASRESGEKVSVPVPLVLSANESVV